MHWLLTLGECELSSLVRRFKSRSAIAVNRRSNMAGARVWQPGFHDHALRREEDMQEVARYVVANPFRAGLANSLKTYPHWDAAWL
ncbi:MAG: transposase [Sulfuricellaceae bacterium]|jgi:putative transposase